MRGQRRDAGETHVSGDGAGDDAELLLEQLAATNERLRAEVAERLRAEQEARLSEERLRLAMEIVNMGTWDWDITTNQIVWSENVEAVHGLAPGSFDGRYESWLALVHADDRDRVADLVARALRDGVGRYDAELRIRRPDSEVRWLRACGQVYYDQHGAPGRMVGTVIDVSERRWAEDELRRAHHMAEEARAAAEAASSEKNAFLSRMSHELRTPLNAVLGFSQLLEMDAVDGQQESVGHIQKAGRHLLELINEVLDIARIESGDLALSPEPVLVSEVVTEALDLVRPLADARGLSIAAPADGGCDRYVVADRQRIKQVLLNLLSNAIKYNREGGEISLTCANSPTSDGLTSICVRDTGWGIAEEDLERLFLPFERLGADRTGVEGTGVGLTVTQRLVRAMGGEVVVSSDVGRGSVFTVTLPATDPPLLAEDAAGQSQRGPAPAVRVGQEGEAGETDRAGHEDAAGRWHLLSIEDNASNARLLEGVVARRPGWHLTNAAQGRLGIQLARSLTSTGNLDLILLDLHLPDLHGGEVLRQLRADPATARTPVVVLSADATPGAIDRALASGADGYLKKPFIVTDLLEILDTLADGRAPSFQDERC